MQARSEVPAEYTWKIEDLFASVADWQAEKEAVARLIAQIDGKAKGWTASPAAMLALLDLVNEIDMKGSRLMSYASHQSNTDMGNTQFQALEGAKDPAWMVFLTELLRKVMEWLEKHHGELNTSGEWMQYVFYGVILGGVFLLLQVIGRVMRQQGGGIVINLVSPGIARSAAAFSGPSSSVGKTASCRCVLAKQSATATACCCAPTRRPTSSARRCSSGRNCCKSSL